jgi:hypothetical protein
MKKGKREYMTDRAFAELVKSAEQALAYERGAREDYRVTRVAFSRFSQPISGKRVTGFTGGH